MANIYPRRILEVIERRVRTSPVVVLEGPRTVGKTTLLREIATSRDKGIVDLDDPVIRTQVEDDPHRYVTGPRPVLIDEYLRVPPLLEHIKAQLNRDGSPGQFILTGSAHREANRDGLRALVGRMSEVPILPLAQSEVEGRGGNFVESVFDDVEVVLASGGSQTSRDSYISRVLTGGFPLALSSLDRADRDWRLDEYVRQSIEYGIDSLAEVRQRGHLRNLLARYAAQTGQILNMAQAARDVGLKARTSDNYTRLLELLFLIFRLPAWKKTDSGPVKRPKVHVVDSGLGARLLRLSPDKIRRNEPLFLSQYGLLLETFVIGEVRKLTSWMDRPCHLGYWPTSRGGEVDLVIELPDEGAVIGLEIKAASKISPSDWRGLRRMRDDLGSRFRAGLVMYTGDAPYRLGEDIYGVPIDRLWGGDRVTGLAAAEPGGGSRRTVVTHEPVTHSTLRTAGGDPYPIRFVPQQPR